MHALKWRLLTAFLSLKKAYNMIILVLIYEERGYG